jgi:hypothetical protein
LIKDAARETPNRSKIERTVWDKLPPVRQTALGHTRLRQLVRIALADPDQMEFEDEIFPIASIPADLLERRGRRLIDMGQGLISRGNRYLAEAHRQRTCAPSLIEA